MTAPLYDCRCCSSHRTLSASRWFVGSSRSSRSGFCSSSFASATRRRSPPESLVTGSSPGGVRSASIACSSCESRSQPSAASISSCRVPISASRASKSASGSAISAEISLKRSSFALIATPSWMFSSTVLVSSSSGSCMRMPTVKPGVSLASPLDGVSRPAMIFRIVDLPAPFGPTMPILAPGRKDIVTSSRISFSPTALRARTME